MYPILPQKDYLADIQKNILLSKCVKKRILYEYTHSFIFFVKQNSNIQICTLYHVIQKNNDIVEYTRFKLLCMHFMNISTVESICIKIESNPKITDRQIIQWVLKQSYKPITNTIIHSKCDKWRYAIENLCFIYQQIIKPRNIDIIHYLDIGCGNAKKTSLFVQLLRIPHKHVFCTDIESWGPYSSNKSHIPYAFTYIRKNKLQYSSHQFDFITSILTLHHIESLSFFLTEIHRVLKKGGIFLLIDHSVHNDYDRLFINIQHMFYSAFYDKRTNYIKHPDFIYCYNMYEWNYIMYTHGFQLHTYNVLIFEEPFSMKYDNIFYAFYKKI